MSSSKDQIGNWAVFRAATMVSSILNPCVRQAACSGFYSEHSWLKCCEGVHRVNSCETRAWWASEYLRIRTRAIYLQHVYLCANHRQYIPEAQPTCTSNLSFQKCIRIYQSELMALCGPPTTNKQCIWRNMTARTTVHEISCSTSFGTLIL